MNDLKSQFIKKVTILCLRFIGHIYLCNMAADKLSHIFQTLKL